jgi:hypothetical protein
MKHFFVGTVCIAIFAVSAVNAHRSGCHRWRTCPSDTGSYGTTSSPAPTVVMPKTRAAKAPSRPRFAMRRVAYMRAADLLPKSLGSIQRLGSGQYQLSIRKARVWFRIGSKAVRIITKSGAKPVKKTLKATPYTNDNSVYVPAEVMRLVGCNIDTSQLSIGLVTISCGQQVEVISIKKY